MNALPTGWTTCDLKDAIENLQAGFASGQKAVEGGLNHLRMNNISVDGSLNLDLVRTVPANLASQHHILKSGDVLVCTTNSGKLVGKCALFDLEGRFAFSNHLTRLRVRTNAMDPKFLLHQLWLLWKEGDFEHKCKHWVNQSTLPKEELLRTRIAFAPLNEQRCIVAKLEKLLNRVDAAQARLATVPHILDAFRRSILDAACSGRLTAHWRRQNQVVKKYESTSVDGVAEYLGGYAYKSPMFSDSGINQVIRIGNVRPFLLNLEASPVFIPDNTAKQTERFSVLPDDIVISMTGTKYRRDYGHAALVTRNKSRLYLNQRVARLRCGSRILPRFMLYWLQSDSFRDFFFRAETGNVNQGNVGADAIRKAPIELPSLPEQTEIVRRVEALFKTADALEARYRKAKAHVDKLTQSILAKAFRGELVPQDPNDEPASALLDRIRRVRNGEPIKTSSRKNHRSRT